MTDIKLNSDWLDRDLYPFESHILNIDGNKVHYIDEGNGPILFLLHGNPTWSFLYRNIILKLRNSFRCIALDYPGFGLSIATDGYGFTPREHSNIVEKFADALELKDIRLMVQDWGGPIGLGFAGRRPELIHSLIIGNTWAWPATFAMSLVSKIFGSKIGRYFITRNNSMVKFIMESGVNFPLKENELTAYLGPFRTKQSRVPAWIFPKEIVNSKTYLAEVERGLEALSNKSALFIWGEADGAFKMPERVKLQSYFKRSEVLLLNNAKHYIQENSPDEICKAILMYI